MGEDKTIPGLDGSVGEDIYAHTFDNADREVGGVLVGRIDPGNGRPFVTAAIPALHATEARASITFTQDAWEHVHRVMASEHPNDQIVGWYHSHPGFGIFLSEQDLFIHRHFFSGKSQIALVVDPLGGTEGVFGWDDAEIARWYERPTARQGRGAPAQASVEAAAPSIHVKPDPPQAKPDRPPAAPAGTRATPDPQPGLQAAAGRNRLLVPGGALLASLSLGLVAWRRARRPARLRPWSRRPRG